ncbi:unnamed protein product [Pleuronectes platessa]|uniref:Protein kinase domain-containing protein n=1 Tax=Pleuronectes platessa TaxID=8262 RepID=A0A9N7UT72_PLEPL|nr:unnamed protein product [Pleuronectes platessa]
MLMQKAAGEPVSLGKYAAVSILDWYNLKQEIIMKQLVDAAIYLQAKGIFHRDIKAENILIESSSDGL